jgi:hypothetical protein
MPAQTSLPEPAIVANCQPRIRPEVVQARDLQFIFSRIFLWILPVTTDGVPSVTYKRIFRSKFEVPLWHFNFHKFSLIV